MALDARRSRRANLSFFNLPPRVAASFYAVPGTDGAIPGPIFLKFTVLGLVTAFLETLSFL